MYIAALFWFGMMIFFIVMEASTVSLVSIWFAAGSLAATIAALFSTPIWLQVVLFLTVAGLLLACLRPFVRKIIRPKITATNVDAMIGSRGYVTAHVDNLEARGQVKLGGVEWSARSTSGEPIPEKTLVQVDKIEGVKAFVSAVEH